MEAAISEALTLKKYGDKNTPDYYLNNTGVEEGNFSVQLEKSLKSKLFLSFYASTFNTQLGVLRGSHIGNTTDLAQALKNDFPFYTEPNFSYGLDAPKQLVSHHLAKINAKYFLTEDQFIEVLFAGQINNRKEFDIRRGGRTDIPALSLFQSTLTSEVKYTNSFGDNWKLRVGGQNIITDNTNNPETGILPLIPDYLSWKSGWYSTLSKNNKKLFYNLGLRYDYEQQTVFTIGNSIPREVVRFDNVFHSASGLSSLKFKFAETQSLGWNIGFATRNPGIN